MRPKTVIMGWFTEGYLVAYYTTLTDLEMGMLSMALNEKHGTGIGTHLRTIIHHPDPDPLGPERFAQYLATEEKVRLGVDHKDTPRLPYAVIWAKRIPHGTLAHVMSVRLSDGEVEEAVDLLSMIPGVMHALALPIDGPPMSRKEFREVLLDEWMIQLPIERDPREWDPRA